MNAVALFWAWVADTTPPLDPAPFASYGAMGVLAVAGLWFIFRAYQQVNTERMKLQEKLLQSYEVILPALTAATQAVVECTVLLQAMRHEEELKKARQEGGSR